MRNILLQIKYDGSSFSGWQKQPGKRTVQGELEKTISQVFKKDIKIQGSSRTDSGVHALGQCATFQTDIGVPIEKIAHILNNAIKKRNLTAPDFEIVRADEVDENFHPRFDALGKRYIYKILSANQVDIFKRNFYYQLEENLDVDKMENAAKEIIGSHDFKSFMAAGSNIQDDTVRRIYKAGFSQKDRDDKGSLEFEIIGDGFLYNMVRIIVGTLVDIGQGKIDENAMADIINSKDRSKAGHTAPPGGLYLDKVFFSREEMNL